MNKAYITTPIYYVNDVPHVGHAYTTIVADVVTRYWRGKVGADNVFFQVGTDEHGQKIAEAAAKADQEPKAFVDSLAPRFESLWKTLNIGFDAFIRTTNATHEQVAADFLQQLYDKGDIYKDTYEGFYCVGCEEYKTETELVDGRCVLHPNRDIEHKKEENYFFKLTKYADQVKNLIESDELTVWPVERKNEILARLSGEIRDLSISRKSVSWGIKVPWDAEHTFYVWVEALLNYRSVLERDGKVEFWPPTYQFMAKDILWFHAAIWPAMLLAAGMELPKKIVSHGFFTVENQKMSKSIGNVIDPLQMVERYGADATRYLLVSALKFGNDGDLSMASFDERYTGELSNGLGNLLQRTITLVKNAGLPPLPVSVNLAEELLPIHDAIEALQIDEALKLINQHVQTANQNLEANKPWELAKDPSKHNDLVAVLTTAQVELQTIATAIAPFMPLVSEKILAQLQSLEPQPLFPRLS